MKKIVCSGALFYSLETKRFLFLHRTRSKNNNVWGLVGGTNEGSETPWEGLRREIREEIGLMPNVVKTIPLESFISGDDHFFYHTYLLVVKKEFLPILNDEHDGYAWVSYNAWPKPLHKGVLSTLTNKSNLQKIETIFQVVDMIS